ncbi:type II secretion system protein GspN [Candidatus Magnetoovum chiemensis]|nr:type II secretion system protein GspN [Candidatus Magnetoovum chiemensis]
MIKKITANLLIIVVIAAAALFSFWHIAVPESLIESKLYAAVKPYGKIEIKNLKKTLLFGINIEKLSILNGNEELASFDNLEAKVHRASSLKLNGNAAGGAVSALITINKSQAHIKGEIKNALLESIPYLKSQGVEARGVLNGSFSYDGADAEAVLSISGADIKDYYRNGVYVPFRYVNEIKGKIFYKDNTITIKSLTAQGVGIYVRVSGAVVNGYANLKAEIMPDADFPDKQLLTLISPYKEAAGLYVILVSQSWNR